MPRIRKPLRQQPLTFSPFCRSVSAANRLKSRHTSPSGKKLMPDNNAYANADAELSSGSSDEDGIVDGILSQEAVFSDPNPDDFHAVKTLLRTYLDVKEWDLSGFVDLILSQTTVGTFVKLEGDQDNWVYALLTVLNLHTYKDHKCIIELKEFLIRSCQEKRVKDDLESLLGEKSRNVGLLVSQCMLHFPPLPPLYDGVFKEISWATEDEPTEELRKSFRFKHYILITRIEKPRNKSQKKRQHGNNDDEIIYNKPEEEIIHKLSLWSYTFPWQTQALAPHETKKYQLMGLVMLIESEKIPEYLRQLHDSFDQL